MTEYQKQEKVTKNKAEQKSFHHIYFKIHLRNIHSFKAYFSHCPIFLHFPLQAMVNDSCKKRENLGNVKPCLALPRQMFFTTMSCYMTVIQLPTCQEVHCLTSFPLFEFQWQFCITNFNKAPVFPSCPINHCFRQSMTCTITDPQVLSLATGGRFSCGNSTKRESLFVS